jgi:hypothetical protein
VGANPNPERRTRLNNEMRQREQLEIVYVPTARLRPAPYNPNVMSKAEMESLCRSIRQ